MQKRRADVFLFSREPFVMRSWAAEAFFWLFVRPGTSSFFCCFKENSLIMMDSVVNRVVWMRRSGEISSISFWRVRTQFPPLFTEEQDTNCVCVCVYPLIALTRLMKYSTKVGLNSKPRQPCKAHCNAKWQKTKRGLHSNFIFSSSFGSSCFWMLSFEIA